MKMKRSQWDVQLQTLILQLHLSTFATVIVFLALFRCLFFYFSVSFSVMQSAFFHSLSLSIFSCGRSHDIAMSKGPSCFVN